MIPRKIKPIKPFVYMKSERLFRHSMLSAEKATQRRISVFWLPRWFLYLDKKGCRKPGHSQFKMKSSFPLSVPGKSTDLEHSCAFQTTSDYGRLPCITDISVSRAWISCTVTLDGKTMPPACWRRFGGLQVPRVQHLEVGSEGFLPNSPQKEKKMPSVKTLKITLFDVPGRVKKFEISGWRLLRTF